MPKLAMSKWERGSRSERRKRLDDAIHKLGETAGVQSNDSVMSAIALSATNPYAVNTKSRISLPRDDKNRHRGLSGRPFVVA
jgi:hypothetical protein